jgi:hypothetical protein
LISRLPADKKSPARVVHEASRRIVALLSIFQVPAPYTTVSTTRTTPSGPLGSSLPAIHSRGRLCYMQALLTQQWHPRHPRGVALHQGRARAREPWLFLGSPLRSPDYSTS